MIDPNGNIEAVATAALDMFLRFRKPFSLEGEKCEATCGDYRAKVYGGGDATIRIVIYFEPDPEEV